MTTGCDGFLNIYRKTEGDQYTRETQVKVLTKPPKMEAFGKQAFEVLWTADGQQLLVAGEQMLTYVERGSWTVTKSKVIGHKSEISCLILLNEKILATAGLDKVIKVWKLGGDGKEE